MVHKRQSKPTLLFRCVGNIEMALMAKGLSEGIGDEYFDVEGAGEFPQGQETVSLAAIHALETLGIRIATDPLNICKGCFDDDRRFDYAISLSDGGFDQCVHVQEDTVAAIWKLPEAEALNAEHQDREGLLQRVRERTLARLRGLIELCRQPDWASMSKAEKESALTALHERLLEEERKLYAANAGDSKTSKENAGVVSTIPQKERALRFRNDTALTKAVQHLWRKQPFEIGGWRCLIVPHDVAEDLLTHFSEEEVREIEFQDLAHATRNVVLQVHANKFGKSK